MTNDTETLTLTDFLLARIAEDEAWARLAQQSSDAAPWHQGMGPVKGNVISHAGLGIAETRAKNVARFISMHDPARVLAECEAKRRIVERLAQVERLIAANVHAQTEASRGGIEKQVEITALRTHGWELGGRRDAFRYVAEELASVYADHPDYRDECP